VFTYHTRLALTALVYNHDGDDPSGPISSSPHPTTTSTTKTVSRHFHDSMAYTQPDMVSGEQYRYALANFVSLGRRSHVARGC